MKTRALASIAASLALGACAPSTAAEQGERVARDPSYSPSLYNFVSCATCHATTSATSTATPTPTPAADGPIYPGAPLAGALRRGTFWGGSVRTAADAVDLCFRRFMRGGPLDPSAPDSVALYAYLDAIADRGPTEAQPFTVPSMVVRLTGGDATRGRALYQRACASCHGEPHTGAGRPRSERDTRASVIPEDTEFEHSASEGYDQASLETVFVQKVRHGSFLGYAGVMPPFSRESLSDEQLADVVAYLSPTLRATTR